MKAETYLNAMLRAMLEANYYSYELFNPLGPRRARQATKFKEALRRKLAQMEERIATLERQQCKPKKLEWIGIADKNLEFMAKTAFGEYRAFAWDYDPGYELLFYCGKRDYVIVSEYLGGEWDSIDDAIDAAMAAAQADFDKRWRSITDCDASIEEEEEDIS